MKNIEIDPIFQLGNQGLYLFEAQPYAELEGFLGGLSATRIVGKAKYVVSPKEMYLGILPDFRETLDDAGFSQDDKNELAATLGNAVVSYLKLLFPDVSKDDLFRIRVNQRNPVEALGVKHDVIGLRYEPNEYVWAMRSKAAAFLEEMIGISFPNTQGWVPTSPVAGTNEQPWAIDKLQRDPQHALPMSLEFPNSVTFFGLASNISTPR